MKPLGRKAYGSIPHLPGSRVGSGDHHISHGQARIATREPRDRHDLVIVQEKLDGSCCCIANVGGGGIIAITRSGYLAETSPYEQHKMFARWVEAQKKRFQALLCPGERLCGEWMVQAHGTLYILRHEPFVAFDLFDRTGMRIPYEAFSKRVAPDFTTPHLLHTGQPLPISSALDAVKLSGHGAVDDTEGVIYRVERHGKVDFLAKYVKEDKQDGQYFPEITGREIVWNLVTADYLLTSKGER